MDFSCWCQTVCSLSRYSTSPIQKFNYPPVIKHGNGQFTISRDFLILEPSFIVDFHGFSQPRLSTEIPISVNSWGPTSVVRFGAALLINPSQPLMRSWCGHPSGWDLDHLSKFGGCKDMTDLRYCWEMNRNGIFHVVELLINYIYIIIIHVYQDDTSRLKITYIYVYICICICICICM